MQCGSNFVALAVFRSLRRRPRAAVILHVISVESACSSRSAVSFVVVVNNSASTFLTSRVVELGSAEVADEAKNIVAKIDSEMAAWRSGGR